MIQLQLQPELEARLTSQAQARGLALQPYLEELIAAQIGLPRRGSPADAVARIRELRKGLSLGGLSIMELVNEGRRYSRRSC